METPHGSAAFLVGMAAFGQKQPVAPLMKRPKQTLTCEALSRHAFSRRLSGLMG